MNINEIEVKSSENHSIAINGDNYEFKILVLKTDYFRNKSEVLLKIIKNIKVNGKKSTKEKTKILIKKIRSEVNNNLSEFKKYDNFKTVKQHYVKKDIQEKWNKENFTIFKIKENIINDIVFDNNLEDTCLVDYDSIIEMNSKFLSKETFVKEDTFDVCEDDYFIYLEDGIVTILEKFFEDLFENHTENKIIEIEDRKKINVITFFFTPYLDNRIKAYTSFAENIHKNYEESKAITVFFKNHFNKSRKQYNVFLENKSLDTFNMTSDWIEYLFYSQLYDECAASFSITCIMPYSPKSAIFIVDNVSLMYFKKYPFDKEDFLINTVLGVIDKRINTSGDEKTIKNVSYKFDTLIRLADQENKEWLMELNNRELSAIFKTGKLKKVSDIFVNYWRDKNHPNIIEHENKVNDILIQQEKNLKESFKKKGMDLELIIKQLYKK